MRAQSSDQKSSFARAVETSKTFAMRAVPERG
jgi:hypothetical protein